jgi:hypothetical protein
MYVCNIILISKPKIEGFGAKIIKPDDGISFEIDILE